MKARDVTDGKLTWAIETNDVLKGLRKLPDNSVHCVVTSPPYWGLRDYGVEGQLGSEATPEEFVRKMVAVFRQVRRVLRPDGICWVNMGDNWANDRKWGGSTGGIRAKGLHGQTGVGRRKRRTGVKPKDMVGVPWMLAFALRKDGWFLRSDVIWHKPNGMPESAKDRPCKQHEYIFLLTKKGHYFYDWLAGSEPTTGNAHGRSGKVSPPKEVAKAAAGAGHANFSKLTPNVYERRMARTVWHIGTYSFKGAHFATFPPKLVAQCLRLGTSKKGYCSLCAAPWKRIIKKKRVATRPGTGSKVHAEVKGWAKGGVPHTAKAHNTPEGRASQHADSPYQEHRGDVAGNRDPLRHVTRYKTVGWQPTCQCEHADHGGTAVVLDPFGGAGTTVMVARRMGCRAIAFELNPAYADLARRRIFDDAPLFNGVKP